MQGAGIRDQGLGPAVSGRVPVRGTQSFVGVMSLVWKRPSLTGLELLWRWSFGVVALGLAAWLWGARLLQNVQMFMLDPGWGSAATLELWLQAHDAVRLYGMTRHGLILVIVAAIAWAAVSAAGRSLVLQRIAPDLRQNPASIAVIGLLRLVCFAGVLALWFVCASAATDRMVVQPLFQHLDPPLVPFAAVLIFGTLGLFVLWMAASYVFHLAPILSMAGGDGAGQSVGMALRRGPLRSKLIEINLVMGIVKIALLVLALVFSACPLPFSSVETQTFLTWWWVGVAVWYLLASDYFHVVRAAAYVALWRAYAPQSVPAAVPPEAKAAS